MCGAEEFETCPRNERQRNKGFCSPSTLLPVRARMVSNNDPPRLASKLIHGREASAPLEVVQRDMRADVSVLR